MESEQSTVGTHVMHAPFDVLGKLRRLYFHTYRAFLHLVAFATVWVICHHGDGNPHGRRHAHKACREDGAAAHGGRVELATTERQKYNSVRGFVIFLILK